MAMVEIDITYSQRGYCSKRGYRRLEQVLSDCKDLYNAALQERREAYRMAGITVTWVDQNRSLTDVRADWPEREGTVDRRVQRGVLRRLDRAYQAFFRRVKSGEKAGFPRFQSWRRYRTIEIEAPTAAMLKVRADRMKVWVKVKGLPVVEVRTSRPLPPADCLKSLRLVSRRVDVHSTAAGGNDKLAWDVDLVFRVERELLPVENQAVGIDMGVTDRLALSNGELIAGKKSGHKKPRRGRCLAPRSTERETPMQGDTDYSADRGGPAHEGDTQWARLNLVIRRGGPAHEGDTSRSRKAPKARGGGPAHEVAHIQQAIARCQKGSRRQRKLRRRLARIQRQDRVRNRNECHRITTDVVHRFGRIAVEKLAIKNMTRSAAGTIEEPGTNVAAKSGLNREILVNTWGLIRQQLRYKAEWAGREFVEVDPAYTSRICSRCGLEGERDGKDFKCATCGLQWDSDLNAAVNILRRAFGPTGGYVRRNPAGNLPEQALLMPAETQPS